MQRERLLNLINVIGNVPPGHWNMNFWVKTPNGLDNSGLLPQLKSLECGTTGCAFGWYCACNELPLIDCDFNIILTNAMEHFDITLEQTRDIFLPKYSEENTQAAVIARVHKLLEVE